MIMRTNLIGPTPQCVRDAFLFCYYQHSFGCAHKSVLISYIAGDVMVKYFCQAIKLDRPTSFIDSVGWRVLPSFSFSVTQGCVL